MGTEHIQIVIEAVNKATAQLKSAEDSIKLLAASTKESQGAFDRAKSSVLSYVAGFATIGTAIAFLKSSVTQALESEKAQASLKRQVEAAGIQWNRYGATIDAAVQKVSEYAVVQDEEVSAALQRLILVTGNVTGSVKNLSLTLDLARAKGIDFETAATLIGKAMEGNVDMLARFLPEVKDLNDLLGKNANDSQRAEAALKLLQERVGGAAGDIPAATRAVMEFKKAWGDFLEDVGKPLLPVLTSILKLMTDLVSVTKGAETSFVALGTTTMTTTGKIETMVKTTTAGANNEVIPAVKNITKAAAVAANTQGLIQEGLGRAIVDNATKSWKEAGMVQEVMGTQIRDQAVAQWKEAGAVQEALGHSIVAQAQEGLKATSELAAFTTSLVMGTVEQFSQGVGNAIAGAIIYGQNLGEAMKEVMKSIAANLISTLIQMGVQRLITAFIFNTANLKESVARMSALSAQTYAGAFAATASIPLVGPFIAPGVAAGSVATMLAGAAASGAAGATLGGVVAAPAMAEGGIVTSPTMALIGEAGPEAVIPLSRGGGRGMGGETHVHIHAGVLFGNKSEARQMALMIDKELNDLKTRNMSLAFS